MNNYQDLLNQIKLISYYVTGEAVKAYHERTGEGKMKKLLLLAIAIVVVLTIPSLCIAQKCYVITKDTFVFASPYTAYHWAMMSDKETANNFLDRLQDTKEVIYERREKGTKVYKIDKKDFPGGLVMDEIANFSTKKSMGWIFGWDVKDNLKLCK